MIILLIFLIQKSVTYQETNAIPSIEGLNISFFPNLNFILVIVFKNTNGKC